MVLPLMPPGWEPCQPGFTAQCALEPGLPRFLGGGCSHTFLGLCGLSSAWDFLVPESLSLKMHTLRIEFYCGKMIAQKTAFLKVLRNSCKEGKASDW